MSIVDVSVEFLSKYIESWDFSQNPLIVGICGPQGSGKSYLSSRLSATFHDKYSELNCVSVSIDDFYLTHAEQHEKLPKLYPGCDLITSGRGLPGTHSMDMILQLLENTKEKKLDFYIPIYDKSCYNGEGDRLPPEAWIKVESGKPIDILILEGWFAGYDAINGNEDQLREKWKHVVDSEKTAAIKEFFEKIDFRQILLINNFLMKYERIWNYFDEFIRITTDDLSNVYTWRQQQEENLIKIKGKGMSKNEVINFVNRYFPVYKLYYDKLAKQGLTARKTAQQNNLEIKINLCRQIIKVRQSNSS